MTNISSRRTVLAALVVVTGAALSGCAADGSASAKAQGGGAGTTKITIGVLPILDVAPLYLGVQKGIFAKHGLDASIKPAQGGAAMVPAILSDEMQFGFSNVVSLLTAREKGLPIVAAAAGSSSTGEPDKDINAILVAKNSPLRTAKDLEGRKMAINALNNIGDTTITTAVKKAGGDPAKVKFVEVPFPDMPAQLAAGTVDAVWESEPFRTQILDAGGRILFNNLTETYPNLQIAQWFTSERLKKEKPDVVARFTAAMNESMTYASGHSDEVRASLGSFTKISSGVASRLVLPKWPTQLDKLSTTAIGEASRNRGTLATAPDVAGLLGG
ncbi:MAG: transporter substrate-binding protein [Actinomycetota bacterium]|nr:transporter substrate-binding protein [Actinomycetota bacterium]